MFCLQPPTYWQSIVFHSAVFREPFVLHIPNLAGVLFFPPPCSLARIIVVLVNARASTNSGIRPAKTKQGPRSESFEATAAPTSKLLSRYSRLTYCALLLRTTRYASSTSGRQALRISSSSRASSSIPGISLSPKWHTLWAGVINRKRLGEHTVAGTLQPSMLQWTDAAFDVFASLFQVITPLLSRGTC